MPIEYKIDHARRVVLAYGLGDLTAQEIFAYQREVWSRPDVAGYNELVDMRVVERIIEPSSEGVRELARLSASMDKPDRPSKFAIVATSELAFGLGRMYEIYREMEGGSTKEVAVFRTREEAFAFLGTKGDISKAKEKGLGG